MSNIKGYKVFNPDWTCRGFQYEVGKTFKHEGDIKICGSGFHFCKKASDCFNYYNFDSNNKVAEVIATGNVETKYDKSVTDEIIIVREIPWTELLTIVNSGRYCTGFDNFGNKNTGNSNTGNSNTGNNNIGSNNTGSFNTGNCNSGAYNTGVYNTGDNNTGDLNTGNHNTGDWNTGCYNTGHCNVGDYNIGDWNVGDWNIANYSNGLFNTKPKTIYIFDNPSNWTLEDWFNSDVRKILNGNFKLAKWICKEDMTNEEKEQHPEYETTGGYLKVFEFKEACKNMWDSLTDDEKHRVITGLPNFDADKFEQITGINVDNQ